MTIRELKIDELIPYEKNPRKNDGAVDYVAESIKQFGFKVPIVIDKNNTIIAGHTRLKAAKKLGLEVVPCIIADDLTDEQIQAYRLADNKVSEFAEWDFELLNSELLDIVNIDMSDFGFFDEEEEQKEDNPYTVKVEVPQYEIKGEKPSLDELVNTFKAEELIEEIEASNVSDDEKEFLIKAAQRHNVFNYRNVAEYYANASEEMQNLMEKSALIIIDYEDAIRYGYANLHEKLNDMMGGDEDGR